MKALIIQHEASTPPGSTIEWLDKNNISYQIHFFNIGDIDKTQKFDLLIICGGSANVDQEALHPWLISEKEYIRSSIAEGIKIVGLCLGGQLLAEALGGNVFKAPIWEVGWQKVRLLDSNSDMTVFQWHGYQFTTPPGSQKIAESAGCSHQAFTHGKNIIAFQFHPESTVKWVEECAADPDLPEVDTYVQSKAAMIEGMSHQPFMQKWYFEKLDSVLLGI